MIIKNKKVNVLVLCLGILLSLIPFVIAPVCPAMANGMHMGCYYSGRFVTIIGIVITVLSILSIVINNKIVNIIFNIFNIILSLAVVLVPNKIVKIKIGSMKNGMPKYMGFCKKDTMSCIIHHTFTYTTIIASIIAIVSLVLLIYIFIKREDVNAK